MPGTGQRTKRYGGALMAPALALALIAAGCSANSNVGAPDAPSEASHGFSGSSGLGDFFSGASAKAPQTVVGAQPDVNCPKVDVRRGASTLTINPGSDNSAMTLKYQGSFVRVARECALAEGAMVMRIGVEGRIVLGPAGQPGEIQVPLRFAIVEETPTGMRPIATRFVVLPLAIPPGQGNVLFSHVEGGISFALPTPTSQLDEYIAYVGFDPVSAQAQNKPPAKVRPRSKSSTQSPPKPAASAN
jgi:hypothetical protein